MMGFHFAVAPKIPFIIASTKQMDLIIYLNHRIKTITEIRTGTRDLKRFKLEEKLVKR